jgi:hypothetical protein
MALHDRDRAAITRLMHREGVLAFETAGGVFVVPLLQDYLLWTPESDARVRLAAQMHGDAAGTAPEVWSLGDFSPRMREELAARGFDVQSDVDSGYGRFERPRKGLGRLEQRYERALEDPVKASFAADADRGKPRRLVLPPLGHPGARAAAVEPPVQMEDPVRSVQTAPVRRDTGPDPARYPTGTVVERRLNLGSQVE